VDLYDPASAGPASADELMKRDGRTWRELVATPER
jgi:hypothetical protein